MVDLLDDTPIVPGDSVKTFEHSIEARDILNDAEGDLRAWEPSVVPITSNANAMGANLMPKPEALAGNQQQPHAIEGAPVTDGVDAVEGETHPAIETETIPTNATTREAVATDVDEPATVATA